MTFKSIVFWSNMLAIHAGVCLVAEIVGYFPTGTCNQCSSLGKKPKSCGALWVFSNHFIANYSLVHFDHIRILSMAQIDLFENYLYEYLILYNCVQKNYRQIKKKKKMQLKKVMEHCKYNYNC